MQEQVLMCSQARFQAIADSADYIWKEGAAPGKTNDVANLTIKQQLSGWTYHGGHSF